MLIGAAIPRLGLSDYVLSVGVTAFLYMAFAISYDLLVGRVGAFSFAHAAFLGAGSYVTAILMLNFGTPFLVCMLASMAFAVVVGFFVGVPSFRLSLHSFAMGTFGFGAILQLITTNWIGVTRGPLCLNGVPPLQLGIGPSSWTASSVSDYYYAAGVLALMYIGVMWHVMRTRVGRSLLAVRDDPSLASAYGIPLLKYRMFAFLLSSAVAAGVGALMAPYLTVVCPSQLGLPWLVTLIVIVFLGGRGTLAGVVYGAIIFTVLPELLRAADVWREVIYGALIVFGAIYAPDGLAGLFKSLVRTFRRTEEGKWRQLFSARKV
jgi:ABC-type branched-subunit amino acid transport system permease subunit